MSFKGFHGHGGASSDTSDTQHALQIVAGRLLSTRQQGALAEATRASVSLLADQELMDVQKASIEDVFKKYTRLSRERKCFVIDVRPYKDWKRRHLLLSYCIRLSANGKALVDYSKNRYDQKWSQVCIRHDCPVAGLPCVARSRTTLLSDCRRVYGGTLTLSLSGSQG